MENRNNFQLISRIFRGIWLMDKQSALGYMPIISRFVAGEDVSYFFDEDEEEDNRPAAVMLAAEEGSPKYFNSFDDAPEGSTALIRVEGALEKNDICGGPGMVDMGQNIKAADQHPNISSMLMLIDSPGGTVDGTEDLAGIAANTQKPLVAYVDGMAASAGYWISSAANEIILSGNTAMVGSIGTMISMADIRPALEEKGIKFHDVRADKSKDKNEPFYQMLEGNYKPIKEESLNKLNEVFLSNVRANRPDVNEGALTGKVYIGQDALKMNLADAIGNFDYALQRARELQDEQSNSNSNPNKEETMFSKYPKLSKLGKAENAPTQEDIDAVNEELQAAGITSAALVLNSHLEQEDEEKQNLQSQLATAQTNEQNATQRAEQAEQRAEQAEKDRDGWKQKAEQYGAKPAEQHTDPLKPEGDKKETPEEEEEYKFEDFGHNKAAIKEIEGIN